MLRDLLLKKPGNADERAIQHRLQEMHDLIELLTRWSEDVQRLETQQLTQILRLGAGIIRLLDLKNALPLLGTKRRPAKSPPGDAIPDEDVLADEGVDGD